MEIGVLIKKNDKNNKKSKRLQLLRSTTLLKRMRGDLIETFKIMEFQIMVDIFLDIFPKLEIYCQGRFQKLRL